MVAGARATGSLAGARGVAGKVEGIPFLPHGRRGETGMAERRERDDPDEDDEAEAEADDAPPSSLLPQLARRSPPTPAELIGLRRGFPTVVRAFTKLIWWKILQYRDDIEPMSRQNLHQEILTRYWVIVRRFNVPPDIGKTISSIATRTLRGYLRDKRRKQRHARAAEAEALLDPPTAEARVFLQLLLDEVADQLPSGDADLLRWHDLEGETDLEIAARLDIPRETVRTRLRAARARFAAIVSPPSKKDPAP
jgi:RNA polymerase sigma factor (sigma-70 family)